jgi:hypothetical protein
MLNFFSGLIVGIIFIQMAVFSPTVFQTLDGTSAGNLVRAVSPRFFRLLGGLGAAELIAIVVNLGPEPIHYVIGAVSAGLPLICLILLPLKRRAQEQGNPMRAKWLHNVGVTLTVVVLLVNLIIPLLGSR